MNYIRQNLQILELQARLASALGQIRQVISCTVCGVKVTGPYQENHKLGCALSFTRSDHEDEGKPEQAAQTTMDFSFGQKNSNSTCTQVNLPSENKKVAKVEQSIGRKTGPEFRRPDGSFDRSAWAKVHNEKLRNNRISQVLDEKTSQMGLPEGIGGLG